MVAQFQLFVTRLLFQLFSLRGVSLLYYCSSHCLGNSICWQHLFCKCHRNEQQILLQHCRSCSYSRSSHHSEQHIWKWQLWWVCSLWSTGNNLMKYNTNPSHRLTQTSRYWTLQTDLKAISISALNPANVVTIIDNTIGYIPFAILYLLNKEAVAKLRTTTITVKHGEGISSLDVFSPVLIT